jgi:Domain of Unknown Function (DUF1080)
MQRSLHLELLGAFLVALSVSAAEPARNFTVLFPEDGPVTKGWTVRTWSNVKDAPALQTTWDVRDGILYGGKSPTRKWVGTWLLSEREYGDFILEVDFKFVNGGATGNGGVALRAPLYGRPSYNGMELQITDPRYEYSLYRYGASDQLTGAIYKVIPPIKQVYNPGEWNHYRIDLRGPQLKVWLNDVLIQDANLDTVTQKIVPHEDWKEPVLPLSQRPHRGHIGFQELSEPGEQLLYRNARIAVLE